MGRAVLEFNWKGTGVHATHFHLPENFEEYMPVSKIIRLNAVDDVAIAKQQLVAGTILTDEAVMVKDMIPAAHKVAMRAIAEGKPVRRYGQVIGFASKAIEPGEHVHEYNLTVGEQGQDAHDEFARDYRFCIDARPTEFAENPTTFKGIVRSDGRVATRNYIGILSSVNCSATVTRGIADAFRKETLSNYPNVDGVVALTIDGGCCIDSKGAGIKLLRRTLAGYAQHANFAGLIFVGLGCETNQIVTLCEEHQLQESKLFHTFNIQETGGTAKTIAKGIGIVKDMFPEANRVAREEVSAEYLTVALQCGGSDGYSGITANPALGAAVDTLVRNGGTAVLSETPEIYGAEHLLTRRAASREVGEKLVSRIKWWEDYVARNHGEMNNNPTAGNKAGGLTTILEKSLGAVAKGGSTNLIDVYEYAEKIRAKGFVFMDGPGFDPVSITGEVAGGCNLVCFTTGRGSAYGCAPAPSIKLATNTALWQRQQEDMDLNCGEIVEGTDTVQEVGERIFGLMIETASGRKTKSELHGYGQNEFNPWQIGAIM